VKCIDYREDEANAKALRVALHRYVIYATMFACMWKCIKTWLPWSDIEEDGRFVTTAIVLHWIASTLTEIWRDYQATTGPQYENHQPAGEATKVPIQRHRERPAWNRDTLNPLDKNSTEEDMPKNSFFVNVLMAEHPAATTRCSRILVNSSMSVTAVMSAIEVNTSIPVKDFFLTHKTSVLKGPLVLEDYGIGAEAEIVGEIFDKILGGAKKRGPPTDSPEKKIPNKKSRKGKKERKEQKKKSPNIAAAFAKMGSNKQPVRLSSAAPPSAGEAVAAPLSGGEAVAAPLSAGEAAAPVPSAGEAVAAPPMLEATAMNTGAANEFEVPRAMNDGYGEKVKSDSSSDDSIDALEAWEKLLGTDVSALIPNKYHQWSKYVVSSMAIGWEANKKRYRVQAVFSCGGVNECGCKVSLKHCNIKKSVAAIEKTGGSPLSVIDNVMQKVKNLHKECIEWYLGAALLGSKSDKRFVARFRQEASLSIANGEFSNIFYTLNPSHGYFMFLDKLEARVAQLEKQLTATKRSGSAKDRVADESAKASAIKLGSVASAGWNRLERNRKGAARNAIMQEVTKAAAGDKKKAEQLFIEAAKALDITLTVPESSTNAAIDTAIVGRLKAALDILKGTGDKLRRTQLRSILCAVAPRKAQKGDRCVTKY